jgi:outer membrane lipoprotein carrier protein
MSLFASLIARPPALWLALIVSVMTGAGGLNLARAQTPMQAIERYFAQVETMSGRFVQEVRDEDGLILEESRGLFWIARPDRFRWVYEAPFAQEIVADGAELWVYDEELRQVTVRPIDQALGAGPALFLSGDIEALRARFRLSEDDEWLRLEPLGDDWQIEFVRMRFVDSAPRRLEVLDGLGQGTGLDLLELAINPDIDDGVFVFELPVGADLIDGAQRPW